VNEISQYDTITVLEKALPVIEKSHRVLANNIANANTPGFSPARVSFQESLQQALAGETRDALSLKRTHSRHIAFGKAPSGLVFATVLTKKYRQMREVLRAP